MTPGLLGTVLGGFVGLLIGWVAAKAINATLDQQAAKASPEDAAKFATIRRLAGPIVIATTIVEIAVVGYVAGYFLAG
ncbi:hypothetical protein IHQ68_00885 [Chelatococcus sambhunathii]|uniref:ATP synthase F(0) sector subunit c n=1 Tax=Chelatococcus sambhunathii TaxID=363953 RepID=A0ABU1DAU7_9HYPH|nr:hypothetical protein [Chelatococcus sambhunathii]MDR4305181.1 hypothetical protein [Chelatococcus sambhunathii]